MSCTTSPATCIDPEGTFLLQRWQSLELVHFGGQEGINCSHLKYKLIFRDQSGRVIHADRCVSLELIAEVKAEDVHLRVIGM